MSIIFFGFVIIFFYSVRIVLKKLSLDLQIFREKQLETINQTFRAIQDIKVSILERFIANQYNLHVVKKYKLEYFSQIISGIPKIFLEVLVIIILVSFIYFFLLEKYQIDQVFSILSLITIISVRFIPTFNIISSSLAKFQSIGASLNLVSRELDGMNDLHQDNVESKIIFKKEIIFNNLNFKYEERKNSILRNLDLVISKGDFVGIYGGSGSGKSTFLNILSGLITSKEGYLWVDGKKINKENIISWYNSISYVPQNTYIFDDSIKNNICLGIKPNDIDKEKFEKSIFCSALDLTDLDFENFKCGEGGKFLSFGQKQRLAMARGFYKDSQVLILDESTSNLDKETENMILEKINKIKHNMTIIIVSHKMETLRYCNKTYKMESGKLKKTDEKK